MKDSWCWGVTHFAQRRRGGQWGGWVPGEICSGQHEKCKAGAGLRRCDSGGDKELLEGITHHTGEG